MDKSSQPIRLNKFLAERLGLSRREADDLISAGKVTIDGRVATLGDRVVLTQASKTQHPDIRCRGQKVPFDTEYIYVAFNKPVGYVCSRRAQGSAPTLYELLPPKYRKLKTVGRLDKDSSGLILLTNDGDFAYQMTHPKFHKEKVYEVELDKPLAPLHQQMISDYGIMLDDGPSKFTVIKGEVAAGTACPSGTLRAALAESSSPAEHTVPTAASPYYIVILSEGRNRQIRRTFATLGYRVTKLHRTKFGPYELDGDLRAGEAAEIIH